MNSQKKLVEPTIIVVVQIYYSKAAENNCNLSFDSEHDVSIIFIRLKLFVTYFIRDKKCSQKQQYISSIK